KRPRKTPQTPKGFMVLHKRWIVERIFSWLGIFRRLAVDVETLSTTAEAFIQVAAIALKLKQIL
ncbi:MAG: transposase, partial [Alphaproteobacteria bacterium]